MTVNLPDCHICYQNHVSNPSTVWCPECEHVLCLDCEACHSSIQSNKSHVTSSIENYLAVLDESIRMICTHCSNHDQKYQMFCQIHDIPLCHSCMDQHSDCNGESPLAKLVENENNNIEISLRDIEKNILTVKGSLEKNLGTLDEKKQDILSELIIKENCDKIETRINKEVNDLYDKTKNQLDSVLHSLNDKNLTTINYNGQFSILKKLGTDLKTFLALRQLSSNIRFLENDLLTLIANGSFDELSLECKLSGRLGSDTKNLCHIEIQRKPCDIIVNRHKKPQDHDVVCAINSLALINSKLVLSFDIVANWISGCVIIPNGNMLFTDVIDGLICCDPNGTRMFNIPTDPYESYDVTCIDDKTVAVTSNGKKLISIIDIRSRTVIKHIIIDHYCNGVTYKDGTLLVCAERHGILSINLTTDEIATTVQCDLPVYSCITSYKDRLYHTDIKSRTVTCLDVEGNTISTFNDPAVLDGPRGITTDNEGRVYVCDYYKHRVIVLSSDGKQSKIMISSDDGIRKPFALHFDKKRNNLLVATEEKKALLFHVSSS